MTIDKGSEKLAEMSGVSTFGSEKVNSIFISLFLFVFNIDIHPVMLQSILHSGIQNGLNIHVKMNVDIHNVSRDDSFLHIHVFSCKFIYCYCSKP